MERLALYIENKELIPNLKKVLESIKGVSLTKPEPPQNRGSLEVALKELEEGKTKKFSSADELFKDLGI